MDWGPASLAESDTDKYTYSIGYEISMLYFDEYTCFIFIVISHNWNTDVSNMMYMTLQNQFMTSKHIQYMI